MNIIPQKSGHIVHAITSLCHTKQSTKNKTLKASSDRWTRSKEREEGVIFTIYSLTPSEFVKGLIVVVCMAIIGCSHINANDNDIDESKLERSGDVIALATRSLYYFSGRAGTNNVDKAIKWDYLAALKGHGTSAIVLADEISFRDPDNMKDVFRWQALAAMQGQRQGQKFLVYSYIDGRGCETNLIRALAWLILVMETDVAGEKPLPVLYKKLTGKLTENEISEAKSLSIKLKHDIEKETWKTDIEQYEKDPVVLKIIADIEKRHEIEAATNTLSSLTGTDCK